MSTFTECHLKKESCLSKSPATQMTVREEKNLGLSPGGQRGWVCTTNTNKTKIPRQLVPGEAHCPPRGLSRPSCHTGGGSVAILTIPVWKYSILLSHLACITSFCCFSHERHYGGVKEVGSSCSMSPWSSHERRQLDT